MRCVAVALGCLLIAALGPRERPCPGNAGADGRAGVGAGSGGGRGDTGHEQLRRVPQGVAGQAGRAGEGDGARHPRREGSLLRRLPRRRPDGDGPGRHGPVEGFSRRAQARADPGVLRSLSCERDLHAPLRPEAADRSAVAVLDQRARPALEEGRSEGGDLRQLSRRPRHSAPRPRRFEGLPGQRPRHLRPLPLQSAVHGGVQNSHRSGGEVEEERARPGAARAARLLRAGV